MGNFINWQIFVFMLLMLTRMLILNLLTPFFATDSNVNFAELDIPVNAAATALKDYLKQLPPLLPQSQLVELTTIASEQHSCYSGDTEQG